MKTPMLGGAYLSRSLRLNSQRCINLYPEIVETQDGKEIGALYGCPGLQRLATIGDGPIRGFCLSPSRTTLYVVSGSEFYAVNMAWQATLGGTLNSTTGPVSMDRNATQVMVADGASGYIYSSGALVEIADPDFPRADQVGFIDQYFAFNISNTGQWGITALADGSDVDALDIVTAEGSPDNLLGLLVDHREVWTAGTESIEIWVPNPAEEFPFSRSQFIESGVCSAFTLVKLDNSVFWVDQDGIVRRADGYTPRRISTHWVERLLKPNAGDNISDLIAFTEVWEGHAYYHLTSPTQNVTVVYDVAASALAGVPMWHQRAYRTSANELIRERANCAITFNGRVVIGDFEDGRIYALNPETFDDDGDPRKWLRSWRALPTGHSPSKPVFVSRLTVDHQPGVGTAAGQGENPQAILRASRDGGKTWGNEMPRSMGRMGEYAKTLEFGPLGSGRDFVFELSGTDPVFPAFVGAQIEAEAGD